ncbi:hypothetical protein HN604_00440 [archaeon]|jgi:hypothetical protein|nr:hypothetical protein [archaeon]MBT6182636.1 hypothetical protein [archaeon]MBT6606034.1 hypothetical protein [archaeon]MBT7251677.1 hypothetical protein [archaeon]MBT7660534.1 hypothetical protein [archaeon]
MESSKDKERIIQEIGIVILSAFILALTVSFSKFPIFYASLLSFAIIITVNVIAKKIAGYMFEIKVDIKPWTWYQFGFVSKMHFKKPLPMLWLPLIISWISKGTVWWLAVLEFDVSPKTERIARRHGLYRYTQVTEWHIAMIAMWSVIATIVAGIIGYVAGFELFAKLSIFYSVWSIIPLSSTDGSKIFFSSRLLWMFIASILAIFFFWGLVII